MNPKITNDVENRYGITLESKAWASGYQIGFDCGHRVGWSRGYAQGIDEAMVVMRE